IHHRRSLYDVRATGPGGGSAGVTRGGGTTPESPGGAGPRAGWGTDHVPSGNANEPMGRSDRLLHGDRRVQCALRAVALPTFPGARAPSRAAASPETELSGRAGSAPDTVSNRWGVLVARHPAGVVLADDRPRPFPPLAHPRAGRSPGGQCDGSDGARGRLV